MRGIYDAVTLLHNHGVKPRGDHTTSHCFSTCLAKCNRATQEPEFR